MASINISGNGIAGEILVLECFVTRAVNISGSLVIQWIGPDGSPVVSMGPVVVGNPVTSGETTSLTLQFNSLYTSHGGRYACQGDFVSQNIMYTVTALQDVIIQGNISRL